MADRPTRALSALVVLAALLSGCSADASGGTRPLTGEIVDPPFTVADQSLEDLSGEPFTLTEDTPRRLTLVFFGYTECPDICGLVLGNLASAMTRLDQTERDQVDVVFVTTDPARDTPEVIRAYLDRFDPTFRGLTGSIDQIATVAASVGVGLGTRLPSGGYEVDAHTTTTTGVDIDDLAPIYWHQTTSPAEFAADIRTLLGEPS